MTRKPPTKEAFDQMLSWLAPDREQAGTKYQTIHTRLIRIFSCHGCVEPEKLADETIDRVIAKIDWLLQNYVGEPTRYFCGVARNILKEDLKRRLRDEVKPEPQTQSDDDSQQKYDCLDSCMAKLPAQSQSMVLSYYEDEGQAKIARRKKLAEEAGITVIALRLRVFHIREQLSKCMEACLKKSLGGALPQESKTNVGDSQYHLR